MSAHDWMLRARILCALAVAGPLVDVLAIMDGRQAGDRRRSCKLRNGDGVAGLYVWRVRTVEARLVAEQPSAIKIRWDGTRSEIDRDIIVAPFVLELADGQQVRVDPPLNVDVADALDQKVWIDRTRRVLAAELVPGEKIFARGRLERSEVARTGSPYRDGGWGWSLRPTRDRQMLLSSEPMGAGLREGMKRAADIMVLYERCKQGDRAVFDRAFGEQFQNAPDLRAYLGRHAHIGRCNETDKPVLRPGALLRFMHAFERL